MKKPMSDSKVNAKHASLGTIKTNKLAGMPLPKKKGK